MADYRVQLSATKGMWVGDQASFQLTAVVRPARRGVPFPEGRKIIFDFESGVFSKDINNVGVAYLTIKFPRTGVFASGAMLESEPGTGLGDPDTRDTCEVVIPEKPKAKSAVLQEAEDTEALARKAEAEYKVWKLQEGAKPKPKVPKKLSVTFSGQRGQQKLLISVAADDGSLIAGFRGTVVDGEEMKPFETGADGTVAYPTDFTEVERSFEVKAGNSRELIWRGLLLGPKP